MKSESDVRGLEVLRGALATLQRERRALARDIHDRLGQTLTALLFNMHALEQSRLPAEAQLAAVQMRDLAGQVKEEIRRLARLLRPSPLDDRGLPGILQQGADAWAEHTSGVVDIHCGPPPDTPMPLAVEIALFSALKQALELATTRKGVRTISIQVREDRGRIVAIVEDDGAHAAETPALEAAAIAAAVGGTISVEAATSRGLTVTIGLPTGDGAGPRRSRVIRNRRTSR